MPRSFIALPLSKTVRQSLLEIIDEVSSICRNAKWVELNNLHITLRFLGNIDVEMVGSISEIITNVSSQFAPFPIEIEGFGAFPHPKRARIIWAGITRGFEEIAELERKVSDELERAGIDRDKRDYHPHITLGRIRYPKSNIALTKKIEESSGRVIGDDTISKMILMESTLTGKGPIYTPIHIAEFGG
ncbi:MAG: 2'-5' RNA ligase [Candidatus Coatesbacteria bacterium 4484_99]|uniref:RNA 2',3'-cyclic phosphodiesterase n=1 Tax=Candidatus Coatesbacteria bacterium 4484_99 TaxID=1970774 RepID=A0A1W9RZP2_9BACT|nr:MAG: 2'-5' RNA ligase [Candidatus Coatesbacteria bacterium 4484_99]RLC41968.1 MAG: RNA 2',3'-cyclic phosphodiesterase [Candidatus Coatesbacteria bacterium]RLC44701.1 MAG: RNA 2',3'-cyclic phosphodiesterase [Candidatus Coatesbacteria bacterium]HEC80176.1 RNA 2',3'-cyclic phosphodiesterase [Bacillota bacterium]